MTHAPLLVPVGDPAGVGPVVAITAAARAVHDDRVVLLGDAVREFIYACRTEAPV